ncbi:MAG TPA: class I SAM-dependent methyltransferase [Segetibacter sp.]|nr:class I SAM-dependent methyltransferase [Segetibacter sp.]
MITIERFFQLFLEELKINSNLTRYYKYNNNKSSFQFRKAYFIQRLEYIQNHITDENSIIWDCGCGFGTTAIFLAMNGYKVVGNTLEFYYKEIPARLKYWSQYGDISSFTPSYENAYEKKFDPRSIDYIIVQDTLHHLEPFQGILKIFKEVMKPNGKLIAIEENGNNIIIRANRYRTRRNNRIIEIFDERLNKKILFGNENIRSFATWQKEFNKAGFELKDKCYIRLFLPFFFTNTNARNIIKTEQKLWQKSSFLREYFFFGLNFIAQLQ